MTNLKFNIKYYTIKLLAFFGLSIKRDVDLHQSLMTELFFQSTNTIAQKNLEIQKLAEGNKLLRDGWASQRALKVEVEGLRNVHAVLSGENEAYRQECSRLTQEADRLRWAKSDLKRELTETQTLLKTTENHMKKQEHERWQEGLTHKLYKGFYTGLCERHRWLQDEIEVLKKKLAKEEASRICFEFHATMYEQFICDLEGSVPVENGVPIPADLSFAYKVPQVRK